MPYRKVCALEACWYMIRWKLKEVFRMPRTPDHPCAHPGCPRLVSKGRKYCEIHSAVHPEATRLAASRGYDSRWRKARKAFLESNPLCEECKQKGRYVPATDVDHVVAHRGDQLLFWDRSNWRALCHSCHSKKTAREDQRPEYTY